VQQLRTSIDAGQLVTVRDEPWIVLGTEQFDAVRLVHLRGIGDTNRDELRSVASPFDPVHPTAAPTGLQRTARRRVLAAAAATAADAVPWQECWTAASARIELHAWQLEPAMAAVNGAMRILLADHVGQGKTIQAALIVSELFARRLAQRVLVLTPPSLREQWAAEMHERFGLTPTIFDQASLTATTATLPVGVNPWQTAPLIISSIDLVKRPEVRAAIECVAFDLLIVDEAHHVTPSTDRGALVAELAARTPWVVLVTATPHSGDETAFAFLQRLGSGEGEPLVTFRRDRPRPAMGTSRRSRLFMVTPTAAERLLLDAVVAYVHAVRRAGGHGTGASLVASVIARRASSSAEAAAQTLRRRAALLSRAVAPETQPVLPWEDPDAADADLDDAALAMAGLANVREEVEWLERMALLADRAQTRSSKAAAIRRLLSRTSEQVLVFTEYRDAAHQIRTMLSDVSSIAVLHGALSPRERRGVVESFNRGLVRTLVATDAAGEGLNLHHRCRLVVNLELPWTPRRLEQRIGRVDRLGQARRVHAMQLVHRQSFEGTVIARLERRRTIASARMAGASPVERDTVAALQRHLRRMARRDCWSQRRCSVYATRSPTRAHDPAVVLVFTANVVDGGGRAVHTLIVPLAVALLVDAPPRRVLTRRLVRALTANAAVQAIARERAAGQISDVQPGLATLAGAFSRRISICLDALDRRRDGLAWQGSLFDTRAEHHAQKAARTTASMRVHLERMRDSMSALTTLRVSEPRLAAAWLGH
jgi:superfamily II DNA or RNA helicase